jgi:hypothetical protein
MQALRRLRHRVESAMTKMESEIFLRVAGFIIFFGAFFGGQAAMNEDWLWLVLSVTAIGFGAGVYVDSAKTLAAFKSSRKTDEKDEKK